MFYSLIIIIILFNTLMSSTLAARYAKQFAVFHFGAFLFSITKCKHKKRLCKIIIAPNNVK